MHVVSFHPVASYYDTLAKLVFGDSIKKAQSHFLPAIPANSRVLIVGGGSGWILEEILRNSICQQITYLEIAPAMIRRARRRYLALPKTLHADTKVQFIQGSFPALPCNNSYDVVITYFLLDLYTEHEAYQLMLNFMRKLKENGYWLFADFDPKEQDKAPLWQRTLLLLMYRFFRLTTNLNNQSLPDFKQLFAKCGLRHQKSRYFFGSFIRSAVYQK